MPAADRTGQPSNSEKVPGLRPGGARAGWLHHDAELEKRKVDFQPPYHEGQERGYLKLYLDEVTQADTGADFAFLRAVKK